MKSQSKINIGSANTISRSVEEAAFSVGRRYALNVGALIVGLVLCLFHPYLALGQDLTGEIDGTVHDTSGAVIPNAKVTVKNDDQNIVVRTLQTNSQGEFTAPLLPLARYSILVSATGFQSATRSLDVHTGVTSAASIILAPGTVAQTVEVTTDTVVQPQLDSSAAGTLIPSTKITQLSLSSRNFQQLLPLQPGVSGGIPGGTQDRGAIASNGGVNTAEYEINGVPATYNGFFLDGQDLQRRTAGGTQIGAYPGIDFIQEMNLQRSNFGAQYGGSGSAFVSIATKSGNTDFHGSAYGFYRSQIFNANGYFNDLAKVPLPELRYNDFGYEAGGPIWLPRITSRKNAKTFFLFGQEFLRSESSLQETLSNVPTAQQRQGVFSAPVCVAYNAAGNCTSSTMSIVSIDPEARAYLTDIIDKIPLPNSPTDPQGLIVPAPGTNNETQTMVRIDHHFNDKFNVLFRFFNDPFNLRVPYGLRQGAQAPGVGTSNVTDGDRLYFGSGTYVFSSRNVLQVGGGYLSSYVTAQVIGLLLASNSPDIRPTLPYPSTLGRVPNLTIGASGYSAISPYYNREPQTQIFANDTQILGRHALSVGFNLEYQKAGNNTGTTNAGAFTFAATKVPAAFPGGATATQFQQAFANFLVGSVTSFQQVSPDPATFPHTNLYEAYVQDDYHAKSNLTLNMGVRYSYVAVPSSGALNGYPYLPMINFAPNRYNPAEAPTIDTTGLICTKTPCNGGVTPNPNYSPLNGLLIARLNSPYGSKVASQPTLTFAPRFGFSYDPAGSGKTAIRGGFGIYYIQLNNAAYQSQAALNQPNIKSLLISNTSFSDPASTTAAGNPSPQVVYASQVNSSAPYVESYSLDIQHRLGGSTLLDVGYFGNRAVHLSVSEDINEPLPGAFVQKGVIPGNVVTTANTPNLNQIRPYIGYGPINSVEQGFVSNYNSLQASVTKRFRAGSLVTVNYTHSRALTNAVAPQNIYDPAAEWGPDPNGRTNLLNFNFVYTLPFFLGQRSLTGYILGGWEFSGIVSFGSGLFLTANTSAVDPAGMGILATGASESGTGRPGLCFQSKLACTPHSRGVVQHLCVCFCACRSVPAGKLQQRLNHGTRISGLGSQYFQKYLFRRRA